MLSLWKLRVGVEAYYLSQVASGLDDYYTGGGEATGAWVGSAAEGLGLSGEVTGEDLRAVLAGLVPGTGLTPNGTVLRPHPRRVPGFDLTFSVPKSVSVVYALGDVRLQGAVVEAAGVAVRDTLGWLEREACWVRRGSNNRSARPGDGEVWGTRPMAARGFVAAMFRHRTSRAGDPQLHWHVLVANLSQGVDGRWSALDGTALYRTKRAAGAVFQARLRDELTARLGVEWGPVRRDVAEIAGVPRRVVRLFSKRREQIEEWLDAHGRQGPVAAQEATLATRTAKTAADLVALDAAWKLEATVAGWGPEDLEALAATWVPAGRAAAGDGERWLVRTHGHDDDGGDVERVVSFDEWVRVMLKSRLTAHDATFTRTEVTAAVAGALGSGSSVPVIERLTARVLAHPEVVPVASGTGTTGIETIGGPVPDPGAARFTARDLLEAESRFLALVTAGLHPTVAPVDVAVVEAVLNTRPTLGADQSVALRVMVSSGRGVEVVVGRAGTGKTFLLGAVRDCFERSGHRVLGLAPSARAARELEDGAGIVSVTIARHLHTHDPEGAWRAGDVVVVDEAAMTATRDLVRVLDRAAVVGAKVVLVGDHCQLPEVGAGGGFRVALDTLGDGVCELTVNRRQIEPWEHDALDELRHGHVPTAWAAYQAHHRVVLADTSEALEERVIADWWDHDTGGADVLLLAGTRAQAERLNRLARRRLLDTGRLDDSDGLVVGERRFSVGDRVVLLRNTDRLRTANGTPTRVDNGTIAAVTATDATAGILTVAVKGSGRRVVVDREYLAGGWVDHGYALTVHKAQGVTCDVVLAVGPAGLFREAGYTALSRARQRAVLYATVEHADRLAEPGHSTGIPLPEERSGDPEHVMLDRLARSRAKTFISTDDPDALAVADLGRRPLDELDQLVARARQVEQDAPLPDPIRQEQALSRAIHTRERLRVGGRARALDRDNLGTVLAIDDTSGTARVEFVSEHGRLAIRQLDWAQLIPVDRPERTVIPPEAVATLAARHAALAQVRERWAGYLGAHGVELGDRDRLVRAISQREQHLARSLHATNPPWLAVWLSPRPADQTGATMWDDTVAVIAAWRDRHHVPHDTAGLGPRPADNPGGWEHTMLAVVDTVAWLQSRNMTWVDAPRVSRSLAALLARQVELHAIVAAAPDSDHQLVRSLVDGTASSGELHGHLAAAASSARRAWILEHWPEVVELEQVNRLLDHDPLAAWPPATSPQVTAALAQLAGTTATGSVREERTLAHLTALIDRADPENQMRAHLAELDRELVNLDPASEQAAIVQRAIGQYSETLRQARHDRAISNVFARYIAPAPESDDLPTAWVNRIATIVADTVTVPPQWLYRLLDEWDQDGTLAHLDVSALTDRIVSVVCYRDRWAIGGDDPLGGTPTDLAQRLEWETATNLTDASLTPAVELIE